VKGKLANGVGSQYFSRYLGTWCIQHYYHLNRRGRQFSRLLTAEVCASAVVMLDTPRRVFSFGYIPGVGIVSTFRNLVSVPSY
jgi:hypothetical protein